MYMTLIYCNIFFVQFKLIPSTIHFCLFICWFIYCFLLAVVFKRQHRILSDATRQIKKNSYLIFLFL